MGGGFQGRGQKYYADQCVTLEEKFFAEKRRAAQAPEDVAFRAEIDDTVTNLIAELYVIREQVIQEKRAFIEWGEAQTRGVLGLFRGTAREYLAGIYETAAGYDELVAAIDATEPDWRSWLLERMCEAPRNVLVCPAGHENDPSHIFCSVCGHRLAA